MPQRGLLFVFSGPSGAGKNTIMHHVLKAGLHLRQLPTATTRERRLNEEEGREHEFLSEAEFRQRIVDKDLVEWQIIHDKGIYGVPRKTVQRIIETGQVAVADVDVLGAMDLKREFGEDVVLIFVQTPDKASLEKRLRQRPDVKSEEELMTRLRRADFEMNFANEYDYHIINADGQLAESVQQALRIIDDVMATRSDEMPEPRWDTRPIRYIVKGIVVQGGELLQYQNDFPHLEVPQGQLPYTVITRYLQNQLGLGTLPTRQYAENRIVADEFEPPQLIRVIPKTTSIDKNLIYILKPATNLGQLSDGWEWISLDRLHLDEMLQNLLYEAVGVLQTDIKASEQ